MEVDKILAQLREERDQVEDAILALERLAANRGKRRGRPPKWIQEARERRRGRKVAKEKEEFSEPVRNR